MKQGGSKSRSWRGGTSKTSRGYVTELNPSTGRYELQHRLVMATQLGRPLRSEESVHHKNGIRDDNRLDNLELWSSSHPSGQRVDDLVAWASDILNRYAPLP